MKCFCVISTIMVLCFANSQLYSQPLNSKETFTRQDSLRGSLNAERDWWNVQHYSISVRPDYNSRTLTGTNEIGFEVLKPGTTMQLDLQEPMEITAVKWNGKSISFKRDGNAWHLEFPSAPKAGSLQSIVITFS